MRELEKDGQGAKKKGYFSYVMIYGGYYFALAICSSLISVYLMGLGYQAGQVSFLVSMSAVFSMVMQPAAGFLQDRIGRKRISVALLALSGAAGVLFAAQRDYLLLVLFYGLAISLANGSNPYIEKLATVSPFSYRSIRIWGTIGYGVGVQAAGLVYEGISPNSMYWFFCGAILIAAAGVAGSRAMEGDAAGTRERGKNSYRRDVLGNRKFLLYLVLASLFYAVTNLNGTYLPALYQEEGVSVTVTSAILFLATLMEMPVIFLAPQFMDRLTTTKLIGAAFVLLALQFAVYALLPIPALQALVTVICRSSVTMAFIMINLKAVSATVPPAYQMSALTLVAAISRNLTTVLMQNVGGAVADAFSIAALYGILAVLSVAGFLLTVLAKLPGGSDEKMFG